MEKLFGMLSLLIAVGISLFLQITNPDMTGMRLLITFWPYWIAVFLLCGLAIKLVDE